MASSCCSLSLSQRCLALTLNRLQFFSIRSQFNSLSFGPEIVVLPWRAGCALAHTGRRLGASMAISTSPWPSPSPNRLLAALPAADFARLQPHLELGPLPLGWGGYEARGTPGYGDF